MKDLRWIDLWIWGLTMVFFASAVRLVSAGIVAAAVDRLTAAVRGAPSSTVAKAAADAAALEAMEITEEFRADRRPDFEPYVEEVHDEELTPGDAFTRHWRG